LRAAQQRQRLLVERTRSRRAHHAAVDDASLPVEAEEDLGDPLLATRLCYRRIALVTLKQRHDLIPNLIETVKGYAAHERGTLDAVIQARNAAMTAQGPAAQAQAPWSISQSSCR